jgi:hypothetical protein
MSVRNEQKSMVYIEPKPHMHSYMGSGRHRLKHDVCKESWASENIEILSSPLFSLDPWQSGEMASTPFGGNLEQTTCVHTFFVICLLINLCHTILFCSHHWSCDNSTGVTNASSRFPSRYHARLTAIIFRGHRGPVLCLRRFYTVCHTHEVCSLVPHGPFFSGAGTENPGLHFSLSTHLSLI